MPGEHKGLSAGEKVQIPSSKTKEEGRLQMKKPELDTSRVVWMHRGRKCLIKSYQKNYWNGVFRGYGSARKCFSVGKHMLWFLLRDKNELIHERYACKPS